MMSEKQRKFREQYKSQISPLYNGLAHILAIYGIGIAGIYYFLQQMNHATWEWLLVVPIFFVANLFEWFMHKYVMHRRIDVWGLRAIYHRHTIQHHQYFTDNEMTVDGAREFRIIFFPPYALLTFMALSIPPALALGYRINPNIGWVLMCTTTGQYLIYETFHYCCHVHENWFVRNLPFVNTIRRHHTAHHNLGIMMEKNMNLTFPIADWFMGTSDLDRGLLGHIFNGYNTRYVNPEVERITRKYRLSDATGIGQPDEPARA